MPYLRPRLPWFSQYAITAAVLRLVVAATAQAQTPPAPAPPRHASFPLVSPDGRRVLFAADSSGRPQARVMDADGSNQRALLPPPVANAVWFPDGKRLLTVQATDRTSPRHLVLVNLDGTDPHEIPVQGILFAVPLGDGSSILVGTRDPGAASATPMLRVIRLDGSVASTVALPAVPGQLGAPRPSRDGRRLAFVAAIRDSADISPHATKSSTLYVMNIDGSGLKSVATFPNLVEQISWSYDGTRIAAQNDLPYPHDAHGAPLDWNNTDADIVVIDLASGAIRELKHSGRKYLDETPDWSPDGHIYIQSSRDGIIEIYRMNADGSHQQRLTK